MEEYKYFNIQNAAGEVAHILLYDKIGVDEEGKGISGRRFAEELFRLTKRFRRINVRINSPGGKITDGLSICAAILNINQSTPNVRIDTYVDGLALSIAGLIAVCGKKVGMCNFAKLMLHNPFIGGKNGTQNGGIEQHETLMQVKEMLLTLLATRTGQKVEDLSLMMNQTTWLSAAEAKRQGFVDEVFEHPRKKSMAPSLAAAGNDAASLFDIFNEYPFEISPKPTTPKIQNTTMDLTPEQAEQLRNEVQGYKGDLTAVLNACGLPTDAGRDGILGHVEGLRNEIKRLKSLDLKIESYKTNVENLENEKKRLHDEVAEMKKHEAIALVENAIKEGKIAPVKKEKWLNHAYDNYDMVRDTLADMPTHPNLVSKIKAMGTSSHEAGANAGFEELSFSELSNQFPEKLMLIKEENPVLYKELFRKEYGTEPVL
ncbi:head maturation protease, ClpP-related [Microscilla marina]|uniref:ATP-dependent Clp protease proteolytic subunit n=1 Tax=Microscilla marina ATCC 23134 TaxID=313606 RepID=A1ZY45_MICM2|nr:head maturation protease, ClpP-related [Microscilla marina]EAY24697.1 Clp protease domain protein [Microscilla marina ATCC 23134]